MDFQSRLPLRKVKPFYFGGTQAIASTPAATTGPPKVRRLLRIDFKHPDDDYTLIQKLRLNRGSLVCLRKHRLHLAVIRESFSPKPLQMLEILAQVQHPNIADVLDVYFHDSRLYIVGEHLDVSILDLQFDRLLPEEWEIATIIAEVVKAMSYLLDTLPACELQIDSVRLSLQGDIKLVPDMHYESLQESYTADHEYDSAFLAGILEVLMSHGAWSDKGWSQEALEFSTIPTSNSLTPFMNHVFLSKALSSSRLVPRVRLAMQLLGCEPQTLSDPS